MSCIIQFKTTKLKTSFQNFLRLQFSTIMSKTTNSSPSNASEGSDQDPYAFVTDPVKKQQLIKLKTEEAELSEKITKYTVIFQVFPFILLSLS